MERVHLHPLRSGWTRVGKIPVIYLTGRKWGINIVLFQCRVGQRMWPQMCPVVPAPWQSLGTSRFLQTTTPPRSPGESGSHCIVIPQICSALQRVWSVEAPMWWTSSPSLGRASVYRAQTSLCKHVRNTDASLGVADLTFSKSQTGLCLSILSAMSANQRCRRTRMRTKPFSCDLGGQSECQILHCGGCECWGSQVRVHNKWDLLQPACTPVWRGLHYWCCIRWWWLCGSTERYSHFEHR